MRTSYDPTLVTYPQDVAQRAAIIGAATAMPGIAIGAFMGTLRSETPVLFSIISGAQWAAIGFTFWGTRSAILNHSGLKNWWNVTRNVPLEPRHDLAPSKSDKIRASTISGAFTGMSLGLLFRGPRNVIPGTIMFSLFGWAGQCGYNFFDGQHTKKLREQAGLKDDVDVKPKETMLQRVAKSNWSPMSVLSDDEYEKMMEEKLLRVEAEIAVINDKIEEIRKKQEGLEAQKLVQANNGKK